MSVSKWDYSPEKCDGRPCVGDCNKCNYEPVERKMTAEGVKKFAKDLQRVPERSEEAQKVYDDLFHYFSRMILNSDFVKVVKCKDCKHSLKHGENVYECDCFCAMTTPNFYCADGERRETE